jgi:hypothetical protein
MNFWMIRNELCNVWWFVFSEFLTRSTLQGFNFLNSNSFLMIFSVPDASIGEVQVLFGHHKQ